MEKEKKNSTGQKDFILFEKGVSLGGFIACEFLDCLHFGSFFLFFFFVWLVVLVYIHSKKERKKERKKEKKKNNEKKYPSFIISILIFQKKCLKILKYS